MSLKSPCLQSGNMMMKMPHFFSLTAHTWGFLKKPRLLCQERDTGDHSHLEDFLPGHPPHLPRAGSSAILGCAGASWAMPCCLGFSSVPAKAAQVLLAAHTAGLLQGLQFYLLKEIIWKMTSLPSIQKQFLILC
jgi:hypothetical protein